MNRQKFQNMNPNKIEEIYRRYLNKENVGNTLGKKTLSHEQIKECCYPFPEDPEDKIISGVMLMFMGINQMIVDERGESITETRSKSR